MKDWKTTAGGIVAALGALLPIIAAYVPMDKDTLDTLARIVTAVGAVIIGKSANDAKQ